MGLTKAQHYAMLEFMGRPAFARGMPENFWSDVCSEGLTEEDGKAIFREIARRLTALAAVYASAGAA